MWQSSPAPQQPGQMTVDQVKALVDSGEARLLDVREPDEWAAGHIPGATWIPLDDLDLRYDELDTGQQWVVYCHLGGRSAQAAYFLADMGLPQIVNMLGGIDAWERRGYPTE